MATITQGVATVTTPETINLPEKAGTLSTKEVLRLPKARPGVSKACELTADALRKNPERLNPSGVDADELEAVGQNADELDKCIVDAEALLVVLQQANTLLGANEG